MKKFKCIVTVFCLMLSYFNTVFASQEYVIGFESAEQAAQIKVIGAPDASADYNKRIGSIVLNPNYSTEAYLEIPVDSLDTEALPYIKARYYITGDFGESSYAAIKINGKKQRLFSLVGKKSGIWYETTAKLEYGEVCRRISFAPMCSDRVWTGKNNVYIDYIGFFPTESAANAFSEADDTDAPIEYEAGREDNESVKLNAEKGYVNGYNSRSFAPEKNITRAEAAAVLSKIISDKPEKTELKISDVKEDDWYYEYVAEIAACGIIEDGGNYRPFDYLTRAELAVMIAHMNVLDEGCRSVPSDVNKTDPEYDAICILSGNGIMVGYENGSFCPQNHVTRAQMTVIINRLTGIQADTAAENPYSDLSPDYWAYGDILAASTRTTSVEENNEKPVVTGKYDVNNAAGNEWIPVPLVSQELIDKGIKGGEGAQATTHLAIDSTGDVIMSFTDTGGTFRSLDGGETWERCGRNVNAYSLSTGEIDPNNSERVVAYTFDQAPGNVLSSDYYGCGVYLSEDTGYSYKCVMPFTSSKYNRWRRAFAFDSTSFDKEINGSSIIYFSTPCDRLEGETFIAAGEKEQGLGYNSGPGLYRSDDGGKTWKNINNQYGGKQIAVCHGDGSVFVIDKGGLMKSSDRGESFKSVINGDFTSITTITTQPDNVYLSDGSGVLVSTDRGESFRRVANSTFPGKKANNLSVSPVNPKNMLVSNNPDTVNQLNTWYSNDGGATWKESGYDSSDDFYEHQPRWKYTVWSPKDEKKCWSVSDWVESSEDAGKTFHWNNNGNNGSCINSPFYPNVYNPDMFLVPAQDFQGAVTFDGGKTFKALHSYPSYFGYGHSYGGYVVDEKTFFVCTAKAWESPDCNLLITHDGGETFEDMGKTGGTSRMKHCLQSPVNKDVLFAGVLRSEDGGYTWKSMDERIYGIVGYNPKGDELIARGKGGVYISVDTGATWEKLFDYPTVYKYNSAEGVCYDAVTKTVYFSIADRIMKYCDGKITECGDRETYNSIYITNMAVDPNDPNVVYAAGISNGLSEFEDYTYNRGIIRSCDAGETWQVISSTDTERTVVKTGPCFGIMTRAMFVNPKDGYLYVGTPNYGLCKIAPPYQK